MMISPESYIDLLDDKSYEGLIKERDVLIKRIHAFENTKGGLDLERMIHPSPKVQYQCNLQYLAKICEFIAEIHNKKIMCKADDDFDNEWIYRIEKFLLEKNTYENTVDERVIERQNGKSFSLSEHLQGLVYSLLSNQRRWNEIASHLKEIDNIFFQFDVDKVKSTESAHFKDEICNIKCGNISITSQMDNLHKNIRIMEEIENEYGSMDAFVTSDFPYNIAMKLSGKKRRDSRYKLHYVGEALAWEYLRNVGIDGAKPDVHLCRFFGGNRMGKGNQSPAMNSEVYATVLKLSKETGFSMAGIDSLVWNYCADGYGEICTEKPKCMQCVIREFCQRERLEKS